MSNRLKLKLRTIHRGTCEDGKPQTGGSKTYPGKQGQKTDVDYHCQIESKVRSITSNKKEHLILIQVQPSKKTRILNLNVPNNITLKYQYINTDRNRKGVTAKFIIAVGHVKDTSLMELGSR